MWLKILNTRARPFNCRYNYSGKKLALMRIPAYLARGATGRMWNVPVDGVLSTTVAGAWAGGYMIPPGTRWRRWSLYRHPLVNF